MLPQISETLKTLFYLFMKREEAGIKKYGTTLDREDLLPSELAQHALEESMDLPLYLVRHVQRTKQLETEHAHMVRTLQYIGAGGMDSATVARMALSEVKMNTQSRG